MVRLRVRRHSSPALLTSITADLDAAEVGWAYWAWKYYGDPTGSAAESLVMADGHLRSTALVLSRTYPQAVAGVPVSYRLLTDDRCVPPRLRARPPHPRARR